VDATASDSEWVLQVVDRALLGDRSALEALYRRFSEAVRLYARSIVQEQHEAEDVTQQVFLKLMTSLGTFSASRGSFHGWLLSVARNTALDTLRRRRTLPVAEVYGPDVAAPDGRSEDAEALTALLEGLPVRQRQVVVLFELGLTAAEIAPVLRATEGGVHVLYHRARKRLCPELTRLGMAPSVATPARDRTRGAAAAVPTARAA
jgi:RNA polymerase sigma-70 factor (ECF subfamily)